MDYRALFWEHFELWDVLWVHEGSEFRAHIMGPQDLLYKPSRPNGTRSGPKTIVALYLDPKRMQHNGLLCDFQRFLDPKHV